MFQTNVQDTDAIRLGSCKIEVGDWPGSFTSMTDLGILKSAKLGAKKIVRTIKPDNAPEVTIESKFTEVNITATLFEWTLDTLELLGLGSVSTEAGTPVSGQLKTILSGAWDYQKFIPVTDQPSGVISGVSAQTDNALTLGTDYLVVTDDAGVTGIIILDSEGVTTTTQNVTITFGYTPAAAKTISIDGDGAQPVYRTVRLTNTNAAGKAYIYKVYKATLTGDFEHAFNADADGEPTGIPIALKGEIDYDQANKIFDIRDQQAV